MADSPSKYKDRIVAWTINCDGKALDDSYKLVYAQVHLAINRIGKATLKFYAGDMDKQTFDETDANSFKPGTAIRIDVGNIDKQNTIFEGVILEIGIKMGRNSRSMMIVECRDYAYPDG